MKKSLISAVKKLLAKLGAEEIEGNNLVEVIDSGADAIEGGGAEPIESITYSALKALRDGGNLIPGQQYRITDYVCAVANDSEARAVSHPYDIIVTADDESTLNENARACLHEDDDYYSAQGAQADLSAWELKYCIDNDTDRFAWADATNGKGVVFWLKDDWGNECPYDFKQIQFKRYKITACTKSPNLVDTYLAASEVSDDITADLTDFIWAYTFSGVFNESVIDTSVYNWVYSGREGTYHCYDNTIKTSMNEHGDIRLNNIVFLVSGVPCSNNTFGNNCWSNTFGNGCQSNTFGNHCWSNTFGNGCQSNTFGNHCWSNTFGNSCGSNTFGNGCQSNTFGNDCGSNTFGNDCGSNTFGNGCQSSKFGDNCSNNTFGNNCWSNTFGNGCQSSKFGDNCWSNTFGNGCESNKFGNGCESNKFGNNCLYNTFGNHCWSNTFGNSCGNNTFGTASGGSTAQNYYQHIALEDGVQYLVLYQATTSSTAYVQNYHVLNGLQGTNNSKINVEVSTNLEYCTFVGKNTRGTVKTYNIMDNAT